MLDKVTSVAHNSVETEPLARRAGVPVSDVTAIVVLLQTDAGVHVLSSLCCDEHTAEGIRAVGEMMLAALDAETVSAQQKGATIET